MNNVFINIFLVGFMIYEIQNVSVIGTLRIRLLSPMSCLYIYSSPYSGVPILYYVFFTIIFDLYIVVLI